jgi:hypothetical protein
VATERAVEIEMIGDRDVGARGERGRLDRLRRLPRGATVMDAHVGQIETEQLRVLRCHRTR